MRPLHKDYYKDCKVFDVKLRPSASTELKKAFILLAPFLDQSNTIKRETANLKLMMPYHRPRNAPRFTCLLSRAIAVILNVDTKMEVA